MNRKKISIILASIILLAIAGVSVVFFNHRKTSTRADAQLAKISDDIGISIGAVEHTATREGVTEWQIEAETAEYFPGRQEVVFNDLTAVFFLENQGQVILTADQGVLKKDTNDIEVTGNVLVKDDMFTLKTHRLYYKHQDRIMTSPDPVEVVSDSWDLEADSMSLDLSTRKARFEGKVKGILGENFSL
ncbi:MAG: LPS export ABC transporter periplasmic protein LptC [Desulfobacterales bacterium]